MGRGFYIVLWGLIFSALLSCERRRDENVREEIERQVSERAKDFVDRQLENCHDEIIEIATAATDSIMKQIVGVVRADTIQIPPRPQKPPFREPKVSERSIDADPLLLRDTLIRDTIDATIPDTL